MCPALCQSLRSSTLTLTTQVILVIRSETEEWRQEIENLLLNWLICLHKNNALKVLSDGTWDTFWLIVGKLVLFKFKTIFLCLFVDQWKFYSSARQYRPQSGYLVLGNPIYGYFRPCNWRKSLAQALLFGGPLGVGKLTLARVLGKKINEKGWLAVRNGFGLWYLWKLDASSNTL